MEGYDFKVYCFEGDNVFILLEFVRRVRDLQIDNKIVKK